MPSLRSLLLQYLTALPDGRHQCTLACPLKYRTFSANSGGTAWKNHFAAWHKAELEHMLQLSDTPQMKRKGDDIVEAGSAAASEVPSSAHSVSTVSKPSSAQRPLTFRSNSSEHTLKTLGIAFAVNSIAYAVVETPEFRALLVELGWSGAPPSRRGLRSAVQQSAAAVRSDITDLLAGAVITVAADGWTNVKRQKITNIVLMLHGKAFYWCSITNSGENTAAWLAQQLLLVIRSLIRDHSARVIGVVVDNEAVNGAAHRLLLPDLPFLVHVPCAAHTIQLVVRSCLELPAMQPIVEQLCALIRFFDVKEHRIALRRMQTAKEMKPLAVLKTCDTRWHALLMAAERMMELHKAVVCCYDADTLPAVDADFFSRLPTLVAFLKPFLAATDAVQRDTATLYTVYQQFQKLRKHAASYPWALPCIRARWEKRVHVAAVTAVAILSFVEPDQQLDRRAAQEFITSFGSEYIAHYQLRQEESKEETADALLVQIADFNSKSGVFSKLSQEIEAVKRSAGESESWQPQRVWSLYPGQQLALVAIALLSLSASEAAVERTFSAQALVHSKRRNALDTGSVEAEMMLKFNRRTLASPQNSNFACIEMVEDASAEDEEAKTVAPEPLEEDELLLEALEPLDEDDMVLEAPAAAAAAAAAPPSSAQQRAIRRQPSISFEVEDEFLAWFIEEEKLQPSSKLNAAVTGSLERHSSKLVRSPGSATLLLHLRQMLNRNHEVRS